MDSEELSGCVRAVGALRAAARQARSWSPARRREVLAELERLDALIVGARSDLLTAEREAETWRGPGVASLGARLGRDTRVGQGAGSARVRQADAWVAVPAIAQAAEAGEITAGHVDAVGRVTRGAAPEVRDLLTSERGQEGLLALARRMDVPSFAKELARTAARLDPTGPDRDLARQRAARFLHLVDAGDGTRISGLLDHRAGRRVRLALEALSPRPAEDDERTPEQRRADALVDVAETVLSLPETASGAAVRPHVSLLMSAETFAEIRGAQRRRSAAPGSPMNFAGQVDPVTDEDGGVVPLSEVARVLCDCFVTRIVLDADGVPLDVGREVRLYTGQQRRAVLARDRGCAWAGCRAPARWCEVHHIAWWDRDGGPTSVENGVTLCRFHHGQVHAGDLHLVRRAADRPPVPVPAGPVAAGPEGVSRPHGRFDPGRPTVAYTILRRDGTVVADDGARQADSGRRGRPVERGDPVPVGA